MRSLRVQLLIGHLLLVLLVAIVMIDATGDLLNISNSFDIVLTKRIELVDSAQRMRESLGKQRSGLALIEAGKQAEGQKLTSEAEMAFDKDLADAERKTLSESDEIAIQRIKQLEKLFKADVGSIIKSQPESPQLQPQYLTVSQVYVQLVDTIHDLAIRNQKAIFTASARAQQFARRAYIKSIFVTLIAIFVALLLSNRILAIVLRPLREVIAVMESLGKAAGPESRKELTLTSPLQEFSRLKTSVVQLESRLESLRKMEAERLEHAQLLAEEAIRSLSEPVITCDASGNLVLMNPASHALLALDGTNLTLDQLPGPIANSLQQALTNAEHLSSHPKPVFLKAVLNDDDRYFRVNATSIKNSDQVLGAVAVLEDVTSWQELDEMKNRFIEVVSHELKTPVTSLILSSELLIEGAADPLTEKQTSLATAQLLDLQRLDKLIKDLLETAKTGYNDRKPVFSEINVVQLIEQACRTVEGLAKEKHINVETFSENNVFKGDESQLQRVLTNLLENAIRHSDEGQTVQIHGALVNNVVRFSVKDEGKGIPEKYLKNIFDRFVQVPGATAGGAGLGLSIARSIVEAHGGQIAVRSQPQIGSEFSFTIPCKPING